MRCFFFKQKTAYEMRISDWSSDVCSSDLLVTLAVELGHRHREDVVARTAMHDVRAVAAEDHIVAVAAVDGVVACTAQEDVFARAAVEYAGFGPAPNSIPAGARGRTPAATGAQVPRHLTPVGVERKRHAEGKRGTGR